MQNKNLKKDGGFIEIIIVIIISLLLMKYYGLTVTEVYRWFMDYFGNVLK